MLGPVVSHHARRGAGPQAAGSKYERFSFAGFLLGLCTLSFFFGLLASALQLAPYRWTAEALSAARALYGRYELSFDQYRNTLWRPANQDARGLVRSNPDLVCPGYTVYSSGDGAHAILVDANGQEVHRWTLPFSRVWRNPPHVLGTVPDHSVYMRRAHVFPNGDLLALYETPVTSPNGMGLARMDVRGQLIWKLDTNCHHDMAVAQDGTIYVLTHTIKASPHPALSFEGRPIIEDQLSVVSPDGKLVRQFSLVESLCRSPFFRESVAPRNFEGDPTHANTVNIVGARFAAHYPEVDPGDLMVCFRNFNLVVIIDPATAECVWATSGPWQMPHDPDPLDNGNILIFDNTFFSGSLCGSRVLEYDPRSASIAWQFTATPDFPFESDVRACQQRLPNGNVLITESSGGRLLEVARDGQVVWEFVNPCRGGPNEKLIPIVAGGTRYSASDLPFLTRATDHL